MLWKFQSESHLNQKNLILVNEVIYNGHGYTAKHRIIEMHWKHEKESKRFWIMKIFIYWYKNLVLHADMMVVSSFATTSYIPVGRQED